MKFANVLCQVRKSIQMYLSRDFYPILKQVDS